MSICNTILVKFKVCVFDSIVLMIIIILITEIMLGYSNCQSLGNCIVYNLCSFIAFCEIVHV